MDRQNRRAAHNRRLAKKRVQCLNGALCFVLSSVLADSLVLRNPLLRQAPKRCKIIFTLKPVEFSPLIKPAKRVNNLIS